MGKHSKHKRRKHTRSESEPPPEGPKWLRYAALGKKRKLRAALAAQPGLVGYADPDTGDTALHQACRHGHADVVGLLLRRNADPNAVDELGNTPGHLAAMHGHWRVLAKLVQSAGQPFNLAAVNHAGLTIQQIMQCQNENAVGTTAADATGMDRKGGGDSSSTDGDGNDHGKGGGPAAAAATAAGDDAAWRARLWEQMSDDEGGWGGLNGAVWGAPAAEHDEVAAHGSTAVNTSADGTAAAAAAGDEDDDDDTWADRLWQDMQDHRRQTAAAARGRRTAAFVGFSRSQADRGAAAHERQRRAEAAAEESARILREEQAKDADWRAAMMQQIEEAATPARRATYESKWAALDSWPPGKPITYKDVPWPPTVSTAAAAAAHRPQPHGSTQHHPQELQLDREQLRALVFVGVKGPDSVKLALRKELMRWHPDKFGARFGGRLAAADKESILAGVQAVAQQLTSLKQA